MMSPGPLRFSLALSLSVALGASCVSNIELDNRPCPCASGWVCCADQNVCIREGARCPDAMPARKVRFGGTLDLGVGLSFRAPVTWSIEEGDRGGQITTDGRYTAPLRSGPFHVIASSLAHPGQETRIEIEVGPTNLETLAGRIGGAGQLDGTGEEVRFGEMNGIVGDHKGHLYVTSNFGARFHPASGSTPAGYGRLGFVRRIDLATSSVSTVATVEIRNAPALGALAIDAQGMLYSVTGARELVRIDPSTGTVTTLLPADPDIGLHQNSVLGVSGDSIYIVRSSTLSAGGGYPKDIARVNLTTGRVESVAGTLTEDAYRDGIGADARIQPIDGAVVDASGAILFADRPLPAIANAPCVLRKLDPTTRAVTTVTRLSTCPAGLVIDARGLLYTAKGNINASTGGEKEKFGIKQVMSRGYPYFVSQWSSAGLTKFETSAASPLFIDGDTIYAADNPHSLIRKSGPIRWGESPDYGTVASAGSLDKIIAGAQRWIGNSDGQGSGARFDHPSNVVVDSKGNVHVPEVMSEYSNIGRARVVSPDGTVRTEGGIFLYAGLAVGAGDRVFVIGASDELNELVEGEMKDLPVTILDGATDGKAFYKPNALTADDRAVYVFDTEQPTGRNRIRRYDLATRELRTLAVLSDTEYWKPQISIDGKGNILTFTRTKVYRVHALSGAITEANLGGAPFDSLTAVAYDPFGLLYVADAQHVRAIVESTGEGFDLVGQGSALGLVGVRTGPLPAFINGISGLAVLPDGNLAVSTSAENSVLIAR